MYMYISPIYISCVVRHGNKTLSSLAIATAMSRQCKSGRAARRVIFSQGCIGTVVFLRKFNDFARETTGARPEMMYGSLV